MTQTKNLSLSRKVLLALAMMVPVFLTVSGPASAQTLLISNQQQVVTNLANSSNALKQQITIGITAANVAASGANAGQILQPNTLDNFTITEQQRQDYNTSLNTYKNTNFSTAQQFLVDQANLAKAQMQGAIDQLAAAAVDLQKVTQVNQLMATVQDVPTASAAKQILQNSGMGTEVTTQQVAAYNQSLASVGEYATKTGAFFAAANNQQIVSNLDMTAANYNRDLYAATAAYSYNSDVLTIQFTESVNMTFEGFMTQQQQSTAAFMNQTAFQGYVR